MILDKPTEDEAKTWSCIVITRVSKGARLGAPAQRAGLPIVGIVVTFVPENGLDIYAAPGSWL
jgi:hypothetical protein